MLKYQGESYKDLEKMIYTQALEYCDYNLTKVREFLGVSRSTIYRKICEYGLSRRAQELHSILERNSLTQK